LTFSEFSKLMVATGYGDGYLKTVEIINLDTASPALVCDNLPSLPNGLTGATGQLFNKKTPIICGGYKPNRIDSCDCYALQNQSWTKILRLNECRRFPASALVTQHEEEVLLITGGYDGSMMLKSVESFDGNEWQEQLPALPKKVWLHCLVKINSTTLLLVGGSATSDGMNPFSAAHFYNVDKNQWSPGPTLNVARAGAGCGVLHWMNPKSNQLEKIVVIAGGNADGYLSTTEMLYVDRIDSYRWIMGPSLPTENGFPSLVEFHNSVILIGGRNPSASKDLYQLSSPGDILIKPFSLSIMLQQKFRLCNLHSF